MRCGFDDVVALFAYAAFEHLALELAEDTRHGIASYGVFVLCRTKPTEAIVLVEQVDYRLDVVFAVVLVQDVSGKTDGFLLGIFAGGGREVGAQGI